MLNSPSLSIFFDQPFDKQIDLLTLSDEDRQKSKAILERLKKELYKINEDE